MSEVQLKIVDGPNVGREFPIGGAVVIGRDPSAGIVLEDSEVSRRHAQVAPSSGGVSISDLGSTNGTFVNGEQLSGERMLLGGEKVRIGTTVLEVSVPVQATKIASVIPEEPDPGATQMASVMSPEEAERAAAEEQADRETAAEDALRHAEPEDDEPTYVPDPPPAAASDAPGGASGSEAPDTEAPDTEAPAAPEPPAPAPAASAGPQSPAAPGPQSPASPGPQSPPPPQPGGFQAPPPPPPAAPAPGGAPFAAPPAPLPAQQAHAQPPAGYQAGPGFQVRSPGEQWALCALVPFYAIVWYYRLCKEIGEWSGGGIDVNPGLSTVAVTIGSWVVIPPFISYSGTAGRIQQCQRAAGLEPTASFGAIFGRMLLLGYGYKWLTEQLNELAVRRPVQ